MNLRATNAALHCYQIHQNSGHSRYFPTRCRVKSRKDRTNVMTCSPDSGYHMRDNPLLRLMCDDHALELCILPCRILLFTFFKPTEQVLPLNGTGYQRDT